MSTHRKIEWALFVLGLMGLYLSVVVNFEVVRAVLFATVSLFAGLHVFHLMDGHKANHVVVASSLTVAAYTAYTSYMHGLDGMLASLLVAVVLVVLSLRLRKDFHKK